MAESSSDQDGDDTDTFAEIDPTGRYGRYNEVLGKGAFKTVYKAFDELEGIEVAWNQIKVVDVLRNPEDLERLYSEVHLLKTLKHKNIIKFYNSWVDTKNDNVNIITEIFTSGNLRQYRKKHKHVDLRALKNWSRQILRGLLYLHSHDPPVIHRDLKCDNVFVNGNQGEVKIGDLGLAAILRQAHAAHSVIGTPEFMAPELYEEDYNELVDIYAFGMCLLELVTFEYPYGECANAAQIYKKVTAGIKPAALAKVKDPEVKQFIEKCIANASERLPARELLKDPFLQCDGEGDSVGRSLLPSSNPQGNNSKESTTEPGPNGDSSNLVNQRSTTGSSSHSDMSHAGNNGNGGPSSDTEEDPTGASRDFTVKGQRKDINTIFLSLRITDSKGHVRNIHFPFDIEADTAISVASEMVTELDLTDQDVTTIAAMIDLEIQAHVPDWVPGASFDDTLGDDIISPGLHESETTHKISPISGTCDSPTDGLILERLPSGRKYWSDSPKCSNGSSPIHPGPSTLASIVDGDEACEQMELQGDPLPPIGVASIENPSLDQSNDSPSHIECEKTLSDDAAEAIKEICISDSHDENGGDILMNQSVDSKCGISSSGENELEDVIRVVGELEHLLEDQQKELEKLKRKHELAIEQIFKGLRPEVQGKVLDEFYSKLSSYTMQNELPYSLQCLKSVVDDESTSTNCSYPREVLDDIVKLGQPVRSEEDVQ
ncbi:probable serine/threonine-protein kinase WNK3 [Amborella trichopoda]|uniref:non-specific serine/threonine protein kinase n=1 Tax=Amborella trichopoda TaxID=13333 RepID=W1Q0D2_AMBTC|nr:probable serine/threonine-protein kinase WNK3 [Amborella trichopoda]ERN13846.1 hypothetical protein AMTR_s00049p00228060 [Amborella trichopoda]|eukprot:XP_006852379.1 probable serine/threonine-protein kinase WNK3 [Amborella trichopoda]